MSITRDQWLAAWDEASGPVDGDDGWMTIKEIAVEMGVNRWTAQRRLDVMIQKGLAQKGIARKPFSNGGPNPSYKPVSCYKLTPK